MIHTHFTKGKKVFLIFKNGDKLVLKFNQAEGKYLLFLDHEPIKIEKLRSVTIYRSKE